MTDLSGGERLQAEPLTVESYGMLCSLAGRHEGGILPTFVQVKHQRETLCARIVGCDRFTPKGASSPMDWFKVETAVHVGWLPARNIKRCSGLADGQCLCVVDQAEGRQPW